MFITSGLQICSNKTRFCGEVDNLGVWDGNKHAVIFPQEGYQQTGCVRSLD